MSFRYVVAMLLLLSGGIAKSQQMSHEEEVVRTTYARLAYAAQVNEIHNLWLEKGQREQIDPVQFNLRMAQGLRFELSDFKVGPVSEILPVNYEDLVTKPNHTTGGSLDIGAGHVGGSNRDANGNVTESTSAIAQARWIPSHDISENWDASFGAIYSLMEEAGKHNRYAAFKVTATFQDRSRAYLAMFLFGPGDGKNEAILAMDPIINGGGLARFITEDAYPGTLIEGGLAGKDPVVREWLRTQQTTQGVKGELHCDAATGRCGINEQDFKKLKPTAPAGCAQRANR
jgi:hypothetical protein